MGSNESGPEIRGIALTGITFPLYFLPGWLTDVV